MKLQGGEAIIHRRPHLLRNSQLPAPFTMRVMAADPSHAAQRMASAHFQWSRRPPSVVSMATHHYDDCGLCWKRRRGTGEGRGWVATESRAQRGCSWAELFSRVNLSTCLCVCGGCGGGLGRFCAWEGSRGWWEVCVREGPASEWLMSHFHNVLMWRGCKSWPAQGFI